MTIQAIRVLLAILGLLGLLSGCVSADLGDAPLFCNAWEPRCPEGYTCVMRDRDEVCVREGQALTFHADGGEQGD